LYQPSEHYLRHYPIVLFRQRGKDFMIVPAFGKRRSGLDLNIVFLHDFGALCLSVELIGFRLVYGGNNFVINDQIH
jgi:hypothetical protein